MTWPKGVVIFVVLFGLYGHDFFYFVLPGGVFWFMLASLVLWIPLLVFSLEALFKLRWKLFSIFAIVWALLSPLVLGVWAPRLWLRGQGLQVSNLLTREYPSGCGLTGFIENGVKQTVGLCRGFDRGNYFDYIVYDTTGEFILPASRRSPEWKRAMSEVTDTNEGLESRENCAYRLFGNLYGVFVDFYDMKG